METLASARTSGGKTILLLGECAHCFLVRIEMYNDVGNRFAYYYREDANSRNSIGNNVSMYIRTVLLLCLKKGSQCCTYIELM